MLSAILSDEQEIFGPPVEHELWIEIVGEKGFVVEEKDGCILFFPYRVGHA